MSANPRRFHQYLAVSIVNIASFSLGCAMTWTSPTLSKLEDSSSFLVIDTNQASWMTSLFSLGVVFGPYPAAYIVGRIGRKWTLNIAAIILTLSYALLILCPLTLWVEQIYISRFIAGFAGGLIYTALPMYVGEISDDVSRASLGSFFAFFLCPGFQLNYCLGPYVSYQVLAWVSLLPGIMYLVLMHFMPESPYYLIQKDRKEEAFKSLMWFREGLSESMVEKEFDTMQVTVEEAMRETGTIKDLFSTRGTIKALILSVSLASFQQLSGINVILFYGETLFALTGAQFSASISTMIIGFVLFFSAGIAPIVARIFSIKNCLIVSGAGMTVFQSILGLYLYYHYLGYSLSGFDWLPVTMLICFILIYGIGFGPLPWAVMAEVFPSNLKPIASCLTVSICYILSFILSKIFVVFDIYIIFMIFSIFCLLSFLFSIFVVPNTKGMSFQEIQNMLNSRGNK